MPSLPQCTPGGPQEERCFSLGAFQCFMTAFGESYCMCKSRIRTKVDHCDTARFEKVKIIPTVSSDLLVSSLPENDGNSAEHGNELAVAVAISAVAIFVIIGLVLLVRKFSLRKPTRIIKFERRLGKGNFSEVFLVTVRDEKGCKKTAAIKVAKANVDTATLWEEASRLLKCTNRHLVCCMGFAFGGIIRDNADRQVPIVFRKARKADFEIPSSFDHAMLIMEFVKYGSLSLILRKPSAPSPWDRPLGLRKRFELALEVAEGMTYLHEEGIIHRDLACRNILIGHEGEVKIGDLGISRLLVDTTYYSVQNKTQALPLCWLAPECLTGNGRFSRASDVYAFGVLFWEIMTDAKRPYGEHNDPSVIQSLILANTKLGKPEGCPDDVYDVMMSCWRSQPESRLDFLSLQRTLRQLIADVSRYNVCARN